VSPYLEIQELYLKSPEERPFGYYLSIHLERGYVYSSPDFFWMGVPVVKSELEAGRYPLTLPSGKPDCWYISALAGDMVKAWSVEPFPLPWIGFDRGPMGRKKLKFYERQRLRTHTT
jgi:hypothetical protein